MRLWTSGNFRNFYRNKLSSNTFYIAGNWQPSRMHFWDLVLFLPFFENNYELFSIAKNAFNALLDINELPLLLLPQQESIWCVNNFEIYQYTGYSHNIVGVAFTKLMSLANTRAGQSERRSPPAPIPTPELSSRLSSHRRILFTQPRGTPEHQCHPII